MTSKNKDDLDDNMVQCSLLQIFIESCHHLTSPDLSHPSPFVKLYVDKVKDAQVTRTKKNKVDPSYGTGFVFTVFNPKEDVLHILQTPSWFSWQKAKGSVVKGAERLIMNCPTNYFCV